MTGFSEKVNYAGKIGENGEDKEVSLILDKEIG